MKEPRIRVTARTRSGATEEQRAAAERGATVVEAWLNRDDISGPITFRTAQIAAAWQILGYGPHAMIELARVLDILKARESQLARASLGV